MREFDGDLEDYRDWLAARNAGERAEAARESAEGSEPVVDRKAQRRAEAEQRQRLSALRKPLESKLAKVEAEMEKLRTKLHALDAIIADADLYSDARRAERQKVMAEHGEHGKRMDELEEQWLEIQGSLEEIDQSEA
ncbi:putative ABC transporter ATP-binding protein [compost metagenome]